MPWNKAHTNYSTNIRGVPLTGPQVTGSPYGGVRDMSQSPARKNTPQHPEEKAFMRQAWPRTAGGLL